MTVYAASGPGIQADVSPAGNLAMAFGHCHQARVINLPTQYDQISGPEVLEPGVRVEWAMHPQTLDRQPVLVQFDSEKFTEDEARAWLSARNIREYTWQPDSRDKTPTTQGNPRAEGEKPPEGFSDLNSFYAATIPVESERASSITIRDVLRSAMINGVPSCGEHECPICGRVFDDDADDPKADDNRRCPSCGELIDSYARAMAAAASPSP
jgi:hypothetical protein